MYLLRNVQAGDITQVYRLAAILNSVNLPADRGHLRELIDLSERSFARKLSNPMDGRYMFVLEDEEKHEIVATSQIIARFGTKEAPNTYFRVEYKEKFSKTLDKGFTHCTLKLTFDEDGPTEMGGLVVVPEHRKDPQHFGKQISFVRFLFLAINPHSFKDTVVAEMLPPFRENGKSELWEAIGRKFTNMDYLEADRLSQTNKEFITSLFPTEEIYVTLLPEVAQNVIGKVGKETEPAAAMLKKIGFSYLYCIDPFDGGPHFGAKVPQISLVRVTQKRKPAFLKQWGKEPSTLGLVGYVGEHGFRAIQASFSVREGDVLIEEGAAGLLKVKEEQELFCMPYAY